MKKHIKKFLSEIIPVIAGILIALFINNWNEERKDKQYVDKIYKNIKKELVVTHKEILEKEKKQQRLLDTLNNYLNNKTSLIEALTRGDGIHLPTIRMNSWKAIKNSKIELLDHEKLLNLSSIEEGKELFKLKTDMVVNFLYNNISNQEKEKKELFKIMFKEVISTQKRLKTRIEKIINE